MLEKKKLLIDVDEVICFNEFIDAINEFLNTNYKIDDFTNYYIDEEAIPKERFEEFTASIKSRNLYANPHIIPESLETIELLSKEYDIYICSACINPFDKNNSGNIFRDKYNFLIKILPFIKPENFIFTNAKHIFNADIIIDDRLPNLDDNIETKILFPSYHNKNISDEELKSKGILRAGTTWQQGWDEVAKILLNK